VPHLVPPRDLMNAMALQSAGFNLTRIVGPTLAGLLIALLGAGENFYLQAAMYLGVAIMVWQLHLPPIPGAPSQSVRENLKEGAAFVWHHPTLRTQMTLALVPVVIGLPYSALMPIFAQDVLQQGAAGFGLLMAAPGLGAVVGTLTIASLDQVKRKGRVLLGAVFGLGGALVLFSLSRSFVLSLLLLVLVGAMQLTYTTTNQTLLQLTIPDELRGRVMGIYMLNQGLLPLGSLLAGALADVAGAPAAVFTMGALLMLLAVAFGTRAPALREL
jgi:MFS transporter, DHA1 family, staphyloferrin A biosynthesis exporter